MFSKLNFLTFLNPYAVTDLKEPGLKLILEIKNIIDFVK